MLLLEHTNSLLFPCPVLVLPYLQHMLGINFSSLATRPWSMTNVACASCLLVCYHVFGTAPELSSRGS
jgi:hypothetical protein